MAGDITPYLGLITSEYGSAPNFQATVAASVQPFADITAVLNGLPSDFNLATATGAQLDVVGQWVGFSRYVTSPISGVYFSFDTTGVGFDQGLIWSAGEPTTGLIAMPDDIYRLALQTQIGINNWNGTIPEAYTILNTMFSGIGWTIYIQDTGNMIMDIIAVTSSTPYNPLYSTLFTGGYFNLRPSGVLANYTLVPSTSVPFFGFDIENSFISGFDVGSFTPF